MEYSFLTQQFENSKDVSCLKHANQTLNAMAVIAFSLSSFLGIAYLLRNMYLCSLILDNI